MIPFSFAELTAFVTSSLRFGWDSCNFSMFYPLGGNRCFFGVSGTAHPSSFVSSTVNDASFIGGSVSSARP